MYINKLLCREVNCHFCTFADNTFYLHRILFSITEADSFINITNSIALGFHCQDFIRNLLLHPDTVILYHKPYTIVFFPSPDGNFASSVCFFFDSVMDRILNKAAGSDSETRTAGFPAVLRFRNQNPRHAACFEFPDRHGYCSVQPLPAAHSSHGLMQCGKR